MKMKQKAQQKAPSKTFDISYKINYAAPNIYPYNAVLLASGGVPSLAPRSVGVSCHRQSAPPGSNGKSPDPDRMLLSYRREIADDNNTKIGHASYLIHAHQVKLDDNKKSGTIDCTFTASHNFMYEDGDKDEYDIHLEGNLVFKLGITDSKDNIDPSFPYLFVTGNTIDNISATSIFKNGIKMNYGRNIVMLTGNGDYRIKGTIDAYIPDCY